MFSGGIERGQWHEKGQNFKECSEEWHIGWIPRKYFSNKSFPEKQTFTYLSQKVIQNPIKYLRWSFLQK